MLTSLTDQLGRAQALSETQVAAAVEQLIDERVTPDCKADFLTALALKGETTAEIAAFARALRDKAVAPPIEPATRQFGEILDVCGTGGDRLNTFNISTTVAIVAAAAGVTVAKHGNRAITSQAGSADVLEALGIPVELTPEQAARSLREHGFAFFFAPKYHPAFRHIAPARKLCAERGQRTIFNFLGPLLNPARPTAQLVGVPRPQLCEPMARVLQSLGIRRGMVVCGEVPNAAFATTSSGTSAEIAAQNAASRPASAHLDELSTLGPNTVAEFYQDRGFSLSVVSPEDFPFLPAQLSDLAGADRHANATLIRRLLHGEERGPKRDAVLLNAAAALFVAARTRTMAEGWDLAAAVLADGRAARKLAELATAPR